MKNFKKLFASLAIVAMLGTAVPTTVLGAASYSTELQGAYNYAYGIGVTTQSSIDTANIYGSLIRSNMAKMMVNYAKEVKGMTPDTSLACTFTDVANQTEEMQGYIKEACQMGLMGQGITAFNPNGVVTRAQFGTVLDRVLNGTANDGGTPYYTAHLNALKDAGVMTNIATPNAPEVRGYVMLMMQRADTGTGTTPAVCTTPENVLSCSLGLDTCPAECVNTTPVVKAGDLNVSLNSASATDGTQVPMNGTIRFAVVDFTANSNDVSLQTVSLKKVGLSTIPPSTRVWFEKNGVRISGKAAFTSDGTAVLSFAPTYVVKAGERASFDLYVQLATQAGNDFQFASTDVSSSAQNVNGAFTTPKLRTADYTVAPVSVDAYTSNAGAFNVQPDAQEVAAFKVANNYTGSDTRDVAFQSITLRQNGNGSLSNLSNIVLIRNGNTVSSHPTVDGKDVTFIVNDTIKQGTTATYNMKANVTNVDYASGDTYQFAIRNTSDVNASETTSAAFRSTVTLTAGASNINLGLYTIQGANVNFNNDSSVALSNNYAAGTDNVILMQGTITTKNAITLEDINHLHFTITTGKTLDQLFSTIYLKIGNSTFSYSPVSTDTGATFLGTTTINSSALVKMYGKLRDTAPVATVQFDDLKYNTFNRYEYVDNSNSIAGAVGSIGGVSVTTQNATLNITRNDGLGNTPIAQGAKGLLAYGIQLTSDQGNGVTVSNLTLNVTSNNTGLLYNNAYATLYINGVAQQSKTINGMTITFDNFNKQIVQGTPVNMQVKVDFADAFNAGTFQLGLNDITAVDSLTSAPITHTTPVGALFTVGSASATLAVSTSNPGREILVSPSTDNKLVAFKITASNDNVKLYNVALTGTKLDMLGNYRLTDASGNVFATASSATATGVNFTNISNAPVVTKDLNSTFTVLADANSNTTGTVAVSVVVNGTQVKSTNGTLVSVTGTPASNTHDLLQNAITVVKLDNTSKTVSSSALKFSITARGKNTVTLNTLTFANALSQYNLTGATLKVLDSNNNTVATGNANGTSATFSSNYNTIDAGSTQTYTVQFVGAVLGGNNTDSWSVSLTNVNFSDGANPYDTSIYNVLSVGTFPLTESK